MTAIIEVPLNPDTWIRGEGTDDSYLLRPSDGKQCCIGQACRYFGMHDDDLINMSEVADVLLNKQCIPEPLEILARHYDRHMAPIDRVYRANDDTFIGDDHKRVALINEDLESLGATFRFTLKESHDD